MSSRLERELVRELRPVMAPDELWLRIEEPGRVHTAMLRWPLWAFAAAIAATIALFCFSLRSDTTSYMAKLAARELTRGGEDVQFRSADPAQIRTWVRSNTGIDVPLPDKTRNDVKLIGASVWRNGSPMACVTFRVGNRRSQLLVASGSAAPPHTAAQQSGIPGVQFFSWRMQGQAYLLASENVASACVLCHAAPRV